ncbi:hypothetical protein VC83_09193 [Pseudogymnoascus destructans]|uniref:Uncharacterized protein n=2 Tax=Pseudogymnoascus destructans TaxID=655981 RepID=L8G3Y3_PSED2|nr:uncharacterized protein VC83_09193 [Pseudogymnoascus destructans]ELR07378.1 hypothetical protein GMDG_08393 [Pseudogymnoascus destructans 20631-21]OAF54568.2 hypothetical protein VC83_09193 [Pseudogymnoascus destructans]
MTFLSKPFTFMQLATRWSASYDPVSNESSLAVPIKFVHAAENNIQWIVFELVQKFRGPRTGKFHAIAWWSARWPIDF